MDNKLLLVQHLDDWMLNDTVRQGVADVLFGTPDEPGDSSRIEDGEFRLVEITEAVREMSMAVHRYLMQEGYDVILAYIPQSRYPGCLCATPEHDEVMQAAVERHLPVLAQSLIRRLGLEIITQMWWKSIARDMEQGSSALNEMWAEKLQSASPRVSAFGGYLDWLNEIQEEKVCQQ